MDSFDKHILSILQKDCTLSTSDIAERVGLSPLVGEEFKRWKNQASLKGVLP